MNINFNFLMTNMAYKTLICTIFLFVKIVFVYFCFIDKLNFNDKLIYIMIELLGLYYIIDNMYTLNHNIDDFIVYLNNNYIEKNNNDDESIENHLVDQLFHK